MSDQGPPGATGFQQATGVQTIDTDLQNIVRAVNRIAQILQPTGAPQNVTGSRASGAALANLLTALANLGFITNNTTP